MADATWVLVALGWTGIGVVGAVAIDDARQLGGLGWRLGLLLGVASWLVLAVMSDPAPESVDGTTGTERGGVTPRELPLAPLAAEVLIPLGIEPEVRAVLTDPAWTIHRGHYTCTRHGARYCGYCAKASAA